MRVGITYDTGFVGPDGLSRERFDPGVVRRELEVVRDDLGCAAVRIVGGLAERIDVAATTAAELGLEVWVSPYPLERTAEQMLALFADCAATAERLRLGGARVVLVTGAELSLMAPGFLPGGTPHERLAQLTGQPELLPARVAAASARLDAFLAEAVATVRARFGGPVTYASIPLERVDPSRFDIVSVDSYRSADTAAGFADGARGFVAAQEKPVAVTEFGCCTWRGAGDAGARGMEVASGDPLRLDGARERDEEGQAAYIGELLDAFGAAGVDVAFVFLLALHSYPHRPDGDPRDDLDLASPGIVRVLEGRHGDRYPDLPWEPKVAFDALAARLSSRFVD